MRRLVLSVAVAALAGCASGGGGGAVTGEGAAPARARSQNVITEAEIAQQSGISNAYDLISRVRPAYLRAGVAGLSGESILPVLRIDGGPALDLADLRNIDIRTVSEIRFHTANDAEVRFGGNLNRPVIAVTLRRSR